MLSIGVSTDYKSSFVKTYSPITKRPGLGLGLSDRPGIGEFWVVEEFFVGQGFEEGFQVGALLLT